MNIMELKSRGCKVMHGVDATKMANSRRLQFTKFDCIVYNFPHAGFTNRQATRDDEIRYSLYSSLLIPDMSIYLLYVKLHVYITASIKI